MYFDKTPTRACELYEVNQDKSDKPFVLKCFLFIKVKK